MTTNADNEETNMADKSIPAASAAVPSRASKRRKIEDKQDVDLPPIKAKQIATAESKILSACKTQKIGGKGETTLPDKNEKSTAVSSGEAPAPAKSRKRNQETETGEKEGQTPTLSGKATPETTSTSGARKKRKAQSNKEKKEEDQPATQHSQSESSTTTVSGNPKKRAQASIEEEATALVTKDVCSAKSKSSTTVTVTTTATLSSHDTMNNPKCPPCRRRKRGPCTGSKTHCNECVTRGYTMEECHSEAYLERRGRKRVKGEKE